jgi:hypothetical protein
MLVRRTVLAFRGRRRGPSFAIADDAWCAGIRRSGRSGVLWSKLPGPVPGGLTPRRGKRPIKRSHPLICPTHSQGPSSRATSLKSLDAVQLPLPCSGRVSARSYFPSALPATFRRASDIGCLALAPAPRSSSASRALVSSLSKAQAHLHYRSATVHKRPQLIGTARCRERYGQPERPGGLEIDDQLHFVTND